MTKPINNYDELDAFVNDLETALDAVDGDFEYSIEKSKGMGSFETFYIDVYFGEKDEYELFTDYAKIRVSGHRDGGSMSDYYIWIEGFTAEELQAVIIAKIKEIIG